MLDRRFPFTVGWGVVAIDAPSAPADLRPWCAYVDRFLAGGGVVVCDVAALPDMGLLAVDAFARLQLSAQRSGCDLRARGACDELLRLWRWVGLSGVGPLPAD